MCTYMCIDMRMRACAKTCVRHVCEDMGTSTCIDMYINMCIDTCIDTGIDMCIDMCAKTCV